MKIIEERLTFDLITTISLIPDYDDIYLYCERLRSMDLFTEAHELETYFTREDFDYYVKLYQQMQSQIVKQ